MAGSRRSRDRPTLATVARVAGVSIATVSKVLNGRPDISAATRTRVEHVLRDLSYVPPSTRPAMGSRSVELVFSDYRNPYFGEILHGVTGAAEEAGIEVVLAQPLASARAWARRLLQGPREGAVVVTSRLTDEHVAAFAAAGKSLVVIDPVNTPKVEISSIGATNWAGGIEATQHLLDLGHRRIAFIGGPGGTAAGLARQHGYRAALENAGLALDRELMAHGPFNYETGFDSAAKLLGLPKPPSAMVAACDPAAFGAIEAARQRGLAVPEDLSVVGFDDTYVAAWHTPPLTTVHQPLQEMGRAAVRVLQGLSAGMAPDTHHVELATHLVVRASTARID